MKIETEKLAKLFLAAVILISISTVLGVAGYLAINPKIEPVVYQPTPSPETAANMEDETVNWKTYRNSDIGIEFKYPDNLGIPEIRLYDSINKADNVLKGKEIYILFKDTNNKYGWLSLTANTVDFKTYYNDSLVFKGNNNIVNECLKPLSYNNVGEVCKIIEVANDKAIWKNYFNEDECSPSFGSQIYFNNKSQSEYKGLSFLFYFDDAMAKVNDLYSCIDGNSTRKAYLEAVIQSKNIMEKKNLSENDLQRMKLVDQILSTFKFIEK